MLLAGVYQTSNFVNVYTKSCRPNCSYLHKYGCQQQIVNVVFSCDNGIIVSNGQQKPPVTSPRHPLMKFTVHSFSSCLILHSVANKCNIALLTALVCSQFLVPIFILPPYPCALTCNFVNLCTIRCCIHVYTHACLVFRDEPIHWIALT